MAKSSKSGEQAKAAGKSNEAAKPKRPGAGGRPSKYKPEYARQAALLGKKGCTDPEVAEFFDVAISTVSLWKLKHPEFSEALKLSKAEADLRVERALFERATGYRCREDDVRVVDGEVVVTTTDKQYPPDPTSMIFWLKNRKPENWRDKPEGFNDDAPPPAAVTVTVVSGRKRADA